MKKILRYLAGLLAFAIALAVFTKVARPDRIVYFMPTKGTINSRIPPFVGRMIHDAQHAKASAIIVQINTFGGRMASDEADNLRTAIQGARIEIIPATITRVPLSQNPVSPNTNNSSGEKYSKKIQRWLNSNLRWLVPAIIGIIIFVIGIVITKAEQKPKIRIREMCIKLPLKVRLYYPGLDVEPGFRILGEVNRREEVKCCNCYYNEKNKTWEGERDGKLDDLLTEYIFEERRRRVHEKDYWIHVFTPGLSVQGEFGSARVAYDDSYFTFRPNDWYNWVKGDFLLINWIRIDERDYDSFPEEKILVAEEVFEQWAQLKRTDIFTKQVSFTEYQGYKSDLKKHVLDEKGRVLDEEFPIEIKDCKLNIKYSITTRKQTELRSEALSCSFLTRRNLKKYFSNIEQCLENKSSDVLPKGVSQREFATTLHLNKDFEQKYRQLREDKDYQKVHKNKSHKQLLAKPYIIDKQYEDQYKNFYCYEEGKVSKRRLRRHEGKLKKHIKKLQRIEKQIQRRKICCLLDDRKICSKKYR